MNANAIVVGDDLESHGTATSSRYARAINASRRVRWEIDGDVIRGRRASRDRSGRAQGYRWQYIGSGVTHPHFKRVRPSTITPDQMGRISQALAPVLQA